MTKNATGKEVETGSAASGVLDLLEIGSGTSSTGLDSALPVSPIHSESEPSASNATISTPSTSPTTPAASTMTSMTPAASANNTNGAATAPISQVPTSSMSTKEGQQDPGLDAPMEVDGNDKAAGPVIAPPGWLAKMSMPDYLRGITKDKAWQELVSSLFRFESLNTTTGVSPYLKLNTMQ